MGKGIDQFSEGDPRPLPIQVAKRAVGSGGTLSSYSSGGMAPKIMRIILLYYHKGQQLTDFFSDFSLEGQRTRPLRR